MPDDGGKSPLPVSAIGEVRGFFDLYLPGLFLLLHVFLVLYCISRDKTTQAFIIHLAESPAKALLIGVPGGYLLGLTLRLARTNLADTIAGRCILLVPRGRRFLRYNSSTKGLHDRFSLCWRLLRQAWNRRLRRRAVRIVCSLFPRAESFPYAHTMRLRVLRHLPSEAREFYDTYRVPRDAHGDLFSFDFWKTIVGSLNERAAKDMYVAEVFVRHAAHMCYAVGASAILLATAAVFQPAPTYHDLLVLLASGETLILLFLLFNLRYLPVAEVETVFTICFYHRESVKRIITGDHNLLRPNSHGG